MNRAKSTFCVALSINKCNDCMKLCFPFISNNWIVSHLTSRYTTFESELATNINERPNVAISGRLLNIYFILDRFVVKCLAVVRRTNIEWALWTFDVVRWLQKMVTHDLKSETMTKTRTTTNILRINERTIVASPDLDSNRCGKEAKNLLHTELR